MHSRRSHQVWMQRKHVSCYNLHNTLTRKQTEAKQELEGEARRGISGAGPTAKREDFGRKEEKVKSGLGKWFSAPIGALPLIRPFLCTLPKDALGLLIFHSKKVEPYIWALPK